MHYKHVRALTREFHHPTYQQGAVYSLRSEVNIPSIII